MNAPAKRGRWFLNSESVMDNFIAFANNARLASRPIAVQIVDAKRSKDQNALSFALYTQIAAQKEDESVQDVHFRCKLDYGVPILRRDNEEFCEVWDNSVGLLPYDKQLIAMKWTEVTSKMSKKQFTEYADTVIREHSMQGYSIVFPGETA